MRILTYIILIIALSACEGSIVVEDLDRDMKCTDSRDGEVFYFNTSELRNIRMGVFGDVRAELIDSEGMERSYTSDMESYIKCVEVLDI